MSDPSLWQDLLEQTKAALATSAVKPATTYRVQLHKEFTFAQTQAIIAYLDALGISDLYTSPYLKARPGSRHGYDICYHRELNPEIGSAADHAALTAQLREHRMGHLFDMVPNHMGVVGNENVWWNDVLENGPASSYARYFDIAWYSLKPDLDGKVLLPILGDFYGKELESGQIHVDYAAGAFIVRYNDHIFPVSPSTYDQILRPGIEALGTKLGATASVYIELLSILTAIAHLPSTEDTEPEQIIERSREKEVIKRRLAALTASAPAIAEHIHSNLRQINCDEEWDQSANFDWLDQLLSAQPYRLSWWRVASDEINYRRFFDINDLAALSMEKLEVFRATHALVLDLVADGKITGLRIDHPDGLFDPREYLQRLQQHRALAVAKRIAASDPRWRQLSEQEIEENLGPELPAMGACHPLYVVVEKILGNNEALPEDWPADGTTGYDFLHAVNGLFVASDNAKAFSRIYQQWTEATTSLRQLVYEKKYLMMQMTLSCELQMLAFQLDRLSEKNRASRDFTLNSQQQALHALIASCEVYRTYITGPDVDPRDRRVLERAIALAKRRNPAISTALFDFLLKLLLLRPHEDSVNEDLRADLVRFVGKFQQLTAPVMAKGFEDTVFYIYNRLISLNEVGCDPGHFGISLEEFHRRNEQRRARHPYGMLATATHDTKRGEDARCRLHVLSEMPDAWRDALERWHSLNLKHQQSVDDEPVLDRNEEYFFYQTLLGAWPAMAPVTSAEQAFFVERIQQFMQKAMHEAKVRTSWINPNPAYDEAVKRFVAGVLDWSQNAEFMADLSRFAAALQHYGLFNSLSQVVVKIASPGVPDTYQGTELWDFSLVDPDNRRPVDYELRKRMLRELDSATDRMALARDLVEKRADGRIKLYVLAQALRLRRQERELFTEGTYDPLLATEPFAVNVCAFMRRYRGRAALAVAPRLLTRVVAEGQMPLGEVWGEGDLVLSADAPRHWRDCFSGQQLTTMERSGGQVLALPELFAHFPVALLLAE